MKIILSLAFLLPVAALSSTGIREGDHPGYPAQWWTPIPREEAKSWEVLPQDAGPGEVILSKRNELGILSNFAATPILVRNKPYASVEGFWQMMKYPEGQNDPRNQNPAIVWPFTREQVGQMVAFEAKAAGDAASQNMKKLGITWITFEGQKMLYKEKEEDKQAHYSLIFEAMKAKVDQNPEVKRILVLTGDLILMPDHKQDADATPSYRYNEIWMKIRGSLHKEKPTTVKKTALHLHR